MFDKNNLQKNITKYEDLFIQKKIAQDNTTFIETLLTNLYEKLKEIEERIKKLTETDLNNEYQGDMQLQSDFRSEGFRHLYEENPNNRSLSSNHSIHGSRLTSANVKVNKKPKEIIPKKRKNHYFIKLYKF